MKVIELKNDSSLLALKKAGLVPLARAIQIASRGRIAITIGGKRLADLEEKRFRGVDSKKAMTLLSQIVDEPLREGIYPLETLLKFQKKGITTNKVLEAFYRKEFGFVAEDLVRRLEARRLKVYMLGSAGTGVVSAIQDLVGAFSSAGYFGRAVPLFDPSKKGAPVSGYGVISREPILSHAAFEVPDIILLFDQKLFPMLRGTLAGYHGTNPAEVAILVNSPLTPPDFRAAADFRDSFSLFTVDADLCVRDRQIPPNYAMIGGMLGILGEKAVEPEVFAKVVRDSLTLKFGPGAKVEANVDALLKARRGVRSEKKTGRSYEALGPVRAAVPSKGQEILNEDGNRAIARAVAHVLNLFPSVVAAYPITPQTQIVEHLAQMIADGTLSAEGVTPESEHGAGGAVLGAARDRVLCFTATCSQGFALMSEIVHCMSGMRMGNIVISDVVRSLNSPLDVENDHSDLNKVGLDAGLLVLMSRDVQQAFDFHILAWLLSLYAEYKPVPVNGGTALEMVVDRSVMLPAIVASEGFEVSHAPERYEALSADKVRELYSDPFFEYVRTYVNHPNRSVMGALQLSNSRMDTDYQRHLAMNVALEILPKIFEKFAAVSGRRYGLVHCFNPEAPVLFVVAGAANGSFEEVAREFHKEGIEVGVAHPNVLRPFPKEEWARLMKGKEVMVYDRDDPFGAVGGRLYTELTGVANEFNLTREGTRLFSRIYGLGGRTPPLSLIRDEIVKGLRQYRKEIQLLPSKEYVGVNL